MVQARTGFARGCPDQPSVCSRGQGADTLRNEICREAVCKESAVIIGLEEVGIGASFPGLAIETVLITGKAASGRESAGKAVDHCFTAEDLFL